MIHAGNNRISAFLPDAASRFKWRRFGLIMCLLACSSSGWTQNLDKRSLAPFSSLQIEGKLEVFLSESGESSISASEDLLKNISIREKEDTLILAGGQGKVYLKFNEFNDLKISGNAAVYSSDTIHSEKLSIVMSGGGDANLLINAKVARVEINGSSDLNLSGKTDLLLASIVSSGDLKAYRLQAASANMILSGSGDAQVNVHNTLQANVSGKGNLYHQGNPTRLETNVTGAGEVIRSNPLGNTDTTRIKLGNRKIIILENKDERSDIGDIIKKDDPKKKKESPSPQQIWAGFEMGLASWLNSHHELAMDTSMKAYSLNQGKSLVYNFNLMEFHAKIMKSQFYLTTGLGIQFNNYYFENNTRLVNKNNNTIALIDTGSSYKKSKLITTYLEAPLYLTFATKPMENGKRFTIAPGIIAGWNFRAYQRRIIEANGGRSKSRNFDDINLTPFRLNLSLRIGYGKFFLFGNYALTTLFQKNQGPGLVPVSIGIRIIGF